MRTRLRDHDVFVGNGGVSGWRGGDAPRLVLWHGAGMDRTVWVLLARYFARHGVDVIAPDLPAHGGSRGEPLGSIEAMAQWGAELIDSLAREPGAGDGPLILAGHSMGSLLALELSARLSERGTPPAALWLLGSAYPMSVAAPLLAAAERNSPVAADIIITFGHAYASRLGHNDVAGISVHNLARALLRRAAPGVLHRDLQACHDYAGGERAAESLHDCAVHLLVGDEDRMTPARGSAALATLLGARTHRIAGSGHMMMNEQPERVLATLRGLLAEVRQDVSAGAPTASSSAAKIAARIPSTLPTPGTLR